MGTAIITPRPTLACVYIVIVFAFGGGEGERTLLPSFSPPSTPSFNSAEPRARVRVLHKHGLVFLDLVSSPPSSLHLSPFLLHLGFSLPLPHPPSPFSSSLLPSMPTSSLTKGAILTFSTAQANNPMPVASPTLQILNIKKIAASDARSIDRYRFIISDGEHFMQAMLATQMNNLVENETLTKGSILLLSEYQINAILGRRIVILLALQPQGHSEKIGQPQGVDSSAPIKTDSSGGQPAPAVNSFQSRSTAPSSSRLQNTSGNDSSASTPPGAYRPPPATGSYQDSSMAAATSTPTSTITPIRALSPYQNK